MNPDPVSISDPMFVLLAWAGGVSLAAAGVTARALVGPGFTWLAAATAAMIGVWPALQLDPLAIAAVVAITVGGALVRRARVVSAVALTVGAGLFVTTAAGLGGILLASTATLALGGVTGEMLLGHWYLVDPTLPRTALRALAYGGIVGVVLDVFTLTATFGPPAGGLLTIVFWVLAVTTAALMAAVVGALRHPAYSGVMAATGLSYLAVLTGLAAVFLGRVVVAQGPM